MNISLKILKKYNIKPKKSLGQNFLVNDDILYNIANIINIEGENIIEIGPGYGALTERLLAKKPKSLTLLELDKSMIDILNSRVKKKELDVEGVDFKVENIDVLKFFPDFKTKKFTKYIIIANIPYYITSPILRHFLYDAKNKPEQMVILIQKDVGDRILNNNKGLMINDKLSTSNNTDNNSSNFLISSKNTSGHSSDILPTNLVFNSRFLVSSKKSSVLSLFVQKKCYVKEVLFVGKENFIPKPKIESSVLLFELHNLYNDVDDETFMNFIKKGFQEPRKKLLKNLVNAGYSKEKVLKTFKILGIDENIRGEDLDVKMWCKLLYGIISEHLKT